MREQLFAYALFLYTGLMTLDEYNTYLDDLFLAEPDNDLLLELEYCSGNSEKTIQIITEGYQEDIEFNTVAFGELIAKRLETVYFRPGTDLREYGDKVYRLWQKLPSDLQMKEPFAILSYADDPLSYGDEERSREMYQEFFQYDQRRTALMKVRVCFYPDIRKIPPYGSGYRPHFRVKGTTGYLGIQFEFLPKVDFGEWADAEVRLLYDIDYSGLIPMTEFHIMEGGHQVGEGVVS